MAALPPSLTLLPTYTYAGRYISEAEVGRAMPIQMDVYEQEVEVKKKRVLMLLSQHHSLRRLSHERDRVQRCLH